MMQTEYGEEWWDHFQEINQVRGRGVLTIAAPLDEKEAFLNYVYVQGELTVIYQP